MGRGEVRAGTADDPLVGVGAANVHWRAGGTNSARYVINPSTHTC
jgi:hypothetical protein